MHYYFNLTTEKGNGTMTKKMMHAHQEILSYVRL